LTSHCTGHYSFQSYLNKIFKIQTIANAHYNFKLYYEYLFYNKDPFISISDFDLFYDKFASLISKKCNFIILNRDPISALKSALNFRMSNSKISNQIYNSNDMLNFCKSSIYYPFHPNNQLNIDNLKDYVDLSVFKDHLFVQHTLIQPLQDKILKSFYIDTKNIEINNIESTLTSLAYSFNFPNFDINEFKSQAYNLVAYLFPFYYFYKNIKITIKQKNYLHDYTDYKSLEDISEIFLKLNIPLLENIQILINPKDYQKLKHNEQFNIFFNEITNILLIIDKHFKKEDKNQIKEYEILNYLKTNFSTRIKIKNILKSHLLHIKQHRPDIVASWKYYQEFEKMCKELDG
ncbi:DUF2972 domain-containing protein, partial [Campylobacter jejuni]|nr:DUF2972 domain-containing protein [Campylobacter jejuni]EAH4891198.1 DUF2972 domain-containing protein [Campylobacter jejuni]EAI4497983.1 DUF2972 domain-containing protein [Campylobacter jejuni]EAK5385245.1 DUF2972 domain-containing protein [Campylobacter jejuni]ECO2550222.1 DUF2972 domain-containing protein [Campylobacter jejuni]